MPERSQEAEIRSQNKGRIKQKAEEVGTYNLKDKKTMNTKDKIQIRPAQQDSIMSNGRLSARVCWPHGQKTKSTPA
jgi:hypothetical protein